ncbi:BaiN/RdsA family NAD(P)/FAD-dependent oxidoreductase [Lunatibacter salilacus]|uniref:NAD(P)/FAD-dependent oxidoreductase n=1 Tax=Lunatibacter salilacus TaxID=2483804 RepID=UPI00131E4C59|nr:NAD(P)/FAD-dependent oxidoreductase [Lunatibacter salilacus]
MYTIGVIGGGAAGFFAAIQAASSGHKVILLEKTSKVLSKVKVSGGGRCNVTHDCKVVSKLIKFYPRGEKFLKKVFLQFSVEDTLKWFSSRGVELKVESDGRMFPVSDSSQTVIDVLVREAEKVGVTIRFNAAVQKVTKENMGFNVHLIHEHFGVDKLIITTGGSPKIENYGWIQSLGHHIVPPVPSLFTFNTPNEPLTELQGIALADTYIRLEGTKLSYEGPLLITHWGLSGPAVLKLSAFGAKWLHDVHYKANAHIRWNKGFEEEQLRKDLVQYKSLHPKRKVHSHPLFGIPQRLWIYLAEVSEINSESCWMNISKRQNNKLLENLFRFTIGIHGKTTFKEEFVTAGGVDLEEINPQTMESRLIPGLYFAGEVINVDGITGGFNFQAAWSTGFLAGINATK